MTSPAPAAQDTRLSEDTADSISGVPRSRPARWLETARPYAPDLGIGLLFLLLAGWLTHGLWPDPGARTLSLNPEDQVLYEWFLATDARALLGDFGLLTDRLNVPDGVNLMANTTVIAPGLLFAPVTLAFGVATTFALLVAGNLGVTAIAWYLLFHRVLGARRLAAAIGGGFCGFAPGMISQTNSHLHMTALWLVPVIVWLVVRLLRAADPGRVAVAVPKTDAGTATDPGTDAGKATGPDTDTGKATDPDTGADPGTTADRGTGADRPRVDRRRIVTSGVGLAAAVTVQVFVGEEVLFLTALTLIIMTVAYALADPSLLRRALRGFAGGLAIAVGLAGLMLAYPLWFQFAGPQSVPNGMFSPYYFSADLASWGAISPLSLAGSDESARLSTGPAEYNTFLGWPLLLASVAAVVWLLRRPAHRPLVIAVTASGLLMAALSLGPDLVINGTRTSVPGPYSLLLGVPVVDGALPMRFALALIPLVATVVVLAVDRALRADGARLTRILVPALAVVALLPIFPTPLPTAARPPLPTFISGGHWRDCVAPGGVLVPVPLPTPKEPWAMRWAAAANNEFGLPEGFFIGPYAARGKASMGTYKQPTSALLAEVAKTGVVPPVTAEQRQQARADLAFWDASCVAVTGDAPHPESLRTTLEDLLGPGTRVADAWTWKVR
ncbi:hypothetical protein ACI2K4_11920 [Micromonospora sp. NPDC050397]|uniref:hypothetical protein n=1 Tax=Micromonospora sp. NPDC050397 TaxID=3364279 RepID=UPI00384C3F2D